MKARHYLILVVLAVAAFGGQLVVYRDHAKSLAGDVVAKDKQSLDTTAEQAALKSYTGTHMLTGQTVFLQASFDRAVAGATAAANPASNGQVYAQAQAACAGQKNAVMQTHCVADYVQNHAAPSANPQAMAQPQRADFTKKFASPPWTPDGSGAAAVAAIVLLASAVSVWRR